MAMQVIIPESPSLPKEGHLFRRFSSKISGQTTGQTEPYIVEVQSLAKKVFGTRIQPWHENAGEFGYGIPEKAISGCYTRSEVREGEGWMVPDGKG